MKKNVLVVGASPNVNRFSNLAVKKLLDFGHNVVAIGNKQSTIHGIGIQTDWEFKDMFHTITLYVGPANQTQLIDKVLKLMPKRIIFNPGTENADFFEKARELGIEVTVDCTLVMLNSNNF